ncbi:MAG: DEAD/DEAH box helicase, partial [Planctomycetes bacterium]|nr:DEAD/DEAH box helicase [Planctomycetota bacterium]
MLFNDLPLSKPILRAIADEGYTTATPIQAQAIPHVLDGRDVLGCAQTGTGKTAAFALPILHRLAANPRHGKFRGPRVLVLAPTRELAGQIAESFQAYGRHLPIRGAVVFGGVSQHGQVRKLQKGIDVLIATPGRLLDLCGQGHVDLSRLEVLVLDEADRMLDMGFIPDIRKVVAQVPRDRQTLLFSATMPGAIRELANSLLRKPEHVQTAPSSGATADKVEQAVYYVDKPHKTDLLAHLLTSQSISRAIVFTRTKHGADRVAKQLSRRDIPAAAIHGNKSQNQRERSLSAFRTGKTHVLIATDIASRGIDVDGVSHVFNYDLSNDPESYVHRIGRTARAGASGLAISFCDAEERAYLRDIQRLIKQDIPVRDDHPEHVPAGNPEAPASSGKPNKGGRPRNQRRNNTRGPRRGGGHHGQGHTNGKRRRNRRRRT